MSVHVIAAGLFLEAGAALIVKGLELALPEVSKLTKSSEFAKIENKNLREDILAATISTIKRLKLQSK